MIYTTITIISIEFRLEQLCVVIMCTTLHKEKKEKRKKEREGGCPFGPTVCKSLLLFYSISYNTI